MKRALVTGSAGFIGAHMVRALSEMTWEVWGMDPRHSGRGLRTELWESRQDMRGWLPTDDQRYDLVVHSAYHVGGRAGIDGPNMNLAHNLELDSALLQWAVQTEQSRVMYFSSSAAYPTEYQTPEWVRRWDAEDVRLQEDDVHLTHVLPPDANYGWAKLTGERMVEAARANGVGVTVLRPFSGYGEDQSLDYPWPSIMTRAIAGDYSVWGPPGQTRDWIHADDVVAGALAVMDSGTTEPVNLCTGHGVEMGELMRMAVAELHSRDPQAHPHAGEIDVFYDETKPTGVFHRVGDPSRLEQYYRPKVSVTEGVARAMRVLS